MSAAELRERRRAKILMGSEERLMKLRGILPKEYEKCDELEIKEEVGNNKEVFYAKEETKMEEERVEDSSRYGGISCSQRPVAGKKTKEESNSLTDSNSHMTNSSPSSELDDENSHGSEKSVSSSSPVYLLRTFLMLFAGILVRIAITSRFSAYVQTLVYPFIALQVLMFGIQHTLNIDVARGSVLKGGIWISIFQLLGIDQDLVETYRQIMGSVYSTVDDFALYLFAFVLTHVVL